MTIHKVAFNPLTRIALIMGTNVPIPTGSIDIGVYDHESASDDLGSHVNHVIFQHIRDLLYVIGVRSMQGIKILTTTFGEAPAILPTVSFVSANAVTEGNTGVVSVVYKIERSTTIGSVMVPWTFEKGNTSENDFIGNEFPQGGFVLIPAGFSSATLTIKVVGDTNIETNESYTIRIKPPQGYAAGEYMSVTGVILNDDYAPPPLPVISLSQGYTVNEGDTFKLKLGLNRKGSLANFNYNWAVVGTGLNPATATDFDGGLPSGNGTFMSNDVEKEISFLITDDALVEPNKTFRVNVTVPGLNNVFANGLIVDTDVVVVPPEEPEEPTDPVDPENPPPFVPEPIADIAFNMSMMEFRPVGAATNTLVPTTEAMQHFVDRNMMTMRLPIRWSYWQPDLAGGLEMAVYGAKVMDALDRAAALGIRVIFDMHEYGYSGKRDGVPVSGRAGLPSANNGPPLITKEDFANFWSLVANQLNGHPAIYFYDLYNEPEGYGEPWFKYNKDGTRAEDYIQPGNPEWLTIVPELFDAATTAIRAVDNKTIIVRGGNHYSGAWDSDIVNPAGFVHNDPVNRTLFACHCYPDRDSSGTLDDNINGSTYAAEIAVEGQAPPMLDVNPNIFAQRLGVFYNQLIIHGCRPVDGIFGVVGEIGLPAEHDWEDVVTNGLDYCRDKGLLPVIWAAGRTYGQGYPFSVEPKPNGLQSKQMSLITPRLDVPEPTIIEVTGPARAVSGQSTADYTLEYRGNNPAPRAITVEDTAGWTWPKNIVLPAGRNPIVNMKGTATNDLINLVTFKVAGLTNVFDFQVPNVDAQPKPGTQALLTSAAYDPYIGLAVMPTVHSVYHLDVTTYAGPIVKLRNSKGEKKDFYPTLTVGDFFVVDQNEIALWAGGSEVPVYLEVAYDQSGGGKHAVYNRQPRYTLNDTKGFPVASHDGGQQVEFGAITTNISGQTLMKRAWYTSGAYFFTSTSNTSGTIGVGTTGYSVHTGTVYDRNTNAGVTTVANGLITDAFHLYAYRARADVLNGLQSFRDGVLIAQTDLAGGPLTWDRANLYQNVRPGFGNGSNVEKMQQTLYSPTAMSDADMTKVRNQWNTVSNLVAPPITVEGVILPDRPSGKVAMAALNDSKTVDGAAWFGASTGSGINGAAWPDYNEISPLVGWGASGIRIPFKMDFCFNADGSLNLWVLNRLSNLCRAAIAAKIFVTFDDHSYKPLTDLSVGTKWAIFANALENGTGKPSTQYPASENGYGGPSQYVAMEIQNEQNKGVKDAVSWAPAARNTIWTIRNGGYQGYLLLAWGDWNNMTYGATALEQVRLLGGVTEIDPYNRTIYTGHDYWNVGRNDQSQLVESKIVIATRYAATLDKAREIGAKLIMSEIGGGISPTGPLTPNVVNGKNGAQMQEEYFAWARANRDVLLGTWFWSAGRINATYRHRIAADSPEHLASLKSFWNGL